MCFIAKKDRSFRLVIDGHEASALHQRPPHVALGSVAAIASVDLSTHALEANFGASAAHVYAASADLRQGVCQLSWPAMGAYFDFVGPIASCSGTDIWDEQARDYIATIDSSTLVYPVLEGRGGRGACSSAACSLATASSPASRAASASTPPALG